MGPHGRNKREDERKDERKDERTREREGGREDERADGWMDGRLAGWPAPRRGAGPSALYARKSSVLRELNCRRADGPLPVRLERWRTRGDHNFNKRISFELTLAKCGRPAVLRQRCTAPSGAFLKSRNWHRGNLSTHGPRCAFYQQTRDARSPKGPAKSQSLRTAAPLRFASRRAPRTTIDVDLQPTAKRDPRAP